MKIVLYDDNKVGLLKDTAVVDVSGIVPMRETPQLTIEGLITSYESLKAALQQALNQNSGIPLADVTLHAPVPRPGKIVAMGGNFGEFVGRKGILWGFMKSPDAVLGPGGTVVLPGHDANIFHHEAELVAVMGKEASKVSADGALSNIFGYMCGCDVSGRFPPEARQQFGKSFDTFAPTGPCIVTADEIPDPHQLGGTDVGRRPDASRLPHERHCPLRGGESGLDERERDPDARRPLLPGHQPPGHWPAAGRRASHHRDR